MRARWPLVGSLGLHEPFAPLTRRRAPQRSTHVIVRFQGSLRAFCAQLLADGPLATLATLPQPQLSTRAVHLLTSFAVFEALLLVAMPGKTFLGPVTAGGNRPVYKARWTLILAPCCKWRRV